MGSLIPLFWTSGDVCPGFQSQGGFPHLHASSPVHNGFLKFTSGATPANCIFQCNTIASSVDTCSMNLSHSTRTPNCLDDLILIHGMTIAFENLCSHEEITENWLKVELYWSESDIAWTGRMYLPVWVALTSDKDKREFSLSRSLQYKSQIFPIFQCTLDFRISYFVGADSPHDTHYHSIGRSIRRPVIGAKPQFTSMPKLLSPLANNEAT